MRRWEWKGDQQTKKEKTTTTETFTLNGINVKKLGVSYSTFG